MKVCRSQLLLIVVSQLLLIVVSNITDLYSRVDASSIYFTLKGDLCAMN